MPPHNILNQRSDEVSDGDCVLGGNFDPIARGSVRAIINGD
jgi:hypothetical protein